MKQSKPEDRSNFKSNLTPGADYGEPTWLWWTDLCNHLPYGGAILAGLDAKVPPPLQDIDDGLTGDVEAGRPAYFQLARRKLLKA